MVTAACAVFTVCGHRPRMFGSLNRELFSSLHLFVSHIRPGVGVSRGHAYRAHCIAHHAGPSTNRVQTVQTVYKPSYKPCTALKEFVQTVQTVHLGVDFPEPQNRNGLYGLYEFLKRSARFV